MADALHIHRATYSYYELGKTQPDFLRILEIAQILAIPVETMVELLAHPEQAALWQTRSRAPKKSGGRPCVLGAAVPGGEDFSRLVLPVWGGGEAFGPGDRAAAGQAVISLSKPQNLQKVLSREKKICYSKKDAPFALDGQKGGKKEAAGLFRKLEGKDPTYEEDNHMDRLRSRH